MCYTLDANILINMERVYAREFFASLWDSMEVTAKNGDICLCEVAQNELNRGNDGLVSWAKSIPGFVRKTTDAELSIVAQIAIAHPQWVQGQKNYGDPFIIAQAKVFNMVVVTEETRKGTGADDKNQKIPNIADEWGVTCIRFFDLLRAQGWRF